MAQISAEAANRLLLVDDDEALLRHMSVSLSRVLSCDIDPFTDGNEAIAAAKTVRYVAAVLDLDMPAIDGISLARALRQLDPDLAVFFLTGSARDVSPAELEDLSPVEVIAKPIKPAVLADKLRPLLA